MTQWITSWRWLLDLLWLTFLLVLLWHFWQDRKYFIKIQAWHVTMGKITQFLWTQESYRLWPKIEYSFYVLDEEIHGNRFFPETAHINLNSKYARKVAYRAAMAYEKDEAINIYYNPYNPREAVLDITMPRKLTFILILLMALIFLHLFIIAYRFL
ncbi:DUF3592 domain-containing protein [Legionella jamestowniensis]|uniref:DUF3592 domain-containing protein n=1 Tax=Legionella jamestowniensis TaxID=455 RepID=A0A0W0UJE3_9GAMM|nr:DUF3592 domain-containing protein [Legionella jamestowniensis]KTD07941.1 hypothetical protein Ljam_2136 [Legionella jamestowniensis]OCH99074.1 hypothetical protein A8135_10050 [Legionella jamestowniensis]SFL64418.1 Protein of unknown function [Legionella jamestowniensis DSM 19215]